MTTASGRGTRMLPSATGTSVGAQVRPSTTAMTARLRMRGSRSYQARPAHRGSGARTLGASPARWSARKSAWASGGSSSASITRVSRSTGVGSGGGSKRPGSATAGRQGRSTPGGAGGMRCGHVNDSSRGCGQAPHRPGPAGGAVDTASGRAAQEGGERAGVVAVAGERGRRLRCGAGAVLMRGFPSVLLRLRAVGDDVRAGGVPAVRGRGCLPPKQPRSRTPAPRPPPPFRCRTLRTRAGPRRAPPPVRRG